MIQFYINSRPTPRAVARYNLEQATGRPPQELNKIINEAIQDHEPARRFLAAYGIEVVRVNP